jgi:hypothetical protein
LAQLRKAKVLHLAFVRARADAGAQCAGFCLGFLAGFARVPKKACNNATSSFEPISIIAAFFMGYLLFRCLVEQGILKVQRELVSRLFQVCFAGGGAALVRIVVSISF